MARGAATLVLALVAAICVVLYLIPVLEPVPAARVLVAALVIVGLVGAVGLWLRQTWGPWLALVALTFTATLACFAWTVAEASRTTIGLSALTLATAATIFVIGSKPSDSINVYQRALFGTVLVFAGWVAVWGWLFPVQFGRALPVSAPPLHARFLGAMYFSGAVFMLLAMLARRWSDIRVVTAILAIWIGALGVVSVLNLSAFDWTRGPTWFWFVAYIGFPLIACWIVWCQRNERDQAAGAPLRTPVRGILLVVGATGVALGVSLLVAPRFMVPLWPWAVSPLLAHIYSAPFLAYGVGCLYAAAQRTWPEARISVIGTFAFAAGVLTASWLHAGLFNMTLPSVWLWFGGFGLAGLALLAAVALQWARGGA